MPPANCWRQGLKTYTLVSRERVCTVKKPDTSPAAKTRRNAGINLSVYAEYVAVAARHTPRKKALRIVAAGV
jgi:hypothetical protein